jgi:predicted MPP superfamily phosphohydrolase
MNSFAMATLGIWSAAVLFALLARRGRFVVAIGVIGGIQALLSIAVVPHLDWPAPLTIALQLAAYVPLLRLRTRGLRPPLYHALVSLPGAWWVAGTLLSLPWAISIAIGHPLPFVWLPFVIAAVGFADSLIREEEVVDVVLDGAAAAAAPERHRSSSDARVARPLKIVQITDPHLGPFMSEARLRRICERAVAREPDLILLTGDLLTIESNRDKGALTRALQPLAQARGRCFACLGNHDYEALDVVRSALASAGVTLLVDEAASVETPAGSVQILGVDFRWQDRSAHLAEVCAANPKPPGHLRLVLLHDPGAFHHLPEGEGDLVLSGHTHGGQVGLLRLGLPHTILSAMTSIPDHGLWARGRDRLYVHRGTGHYGFPLRVGVPAEHSLLQIHLARDISLEGATG